MRNPATPFPSSKADTLRPTDAASVELLINQFEDGLSRRHTALSKAQKNTNNTFHSIIKVPHNKWIQLNVIIICAAICSDTEGSIFHGFTYSLFIIICQGSNNAACLGTCTGILLGDLTVRVHFLQQWAKMICYTERYIMFHQEVGEQCLSTDGTQIIGRDKKVLDLSHGVSCGAAALVAGTLNMAFAIWKKK